jgi:predicted dithiol-disulfide oxidoreductase (DUF899 family)
MQHEVVAHDEWVEARRALLTAEKEFTRARDDLSRIRRQLPWERVDKDYEFDAGDTRRSLGDLFGPHRQLIVYHFMFAPEDEAGCPSCSFWAESFDRNVIHLAARAISRAPAAKLRAYRARMGWTFPWLSSGDGDFNYDFGVAFRPEQLDTDVYNYGSVPGIEDREGVSVFFKDDDGDIFHTYSAYARGIDLLNSAYNYIDLTPRGREEPSGGNPQFWVRRRDEYGD